MKRSESMQSSPRGTQDGKTSEGQSRELEVKLEGESEVLNTLFALELACRRQCSVPLPKACHGIF